jgi:hypothetical protein
MIREPLSLRELVIEAVGELGGGAAPLPPNYH